jgi:LmbE family N-acetylglucosaminyl deacetylase
MAQTILIFSAHPDDAEFFAGGTIARFIQQGSRAIIAIATDGRCGSFTGSTSALAEQRAEEARRAAQVLGAEPPVLLGHPDMELDRLPPGVLRETFIRMIRQYRPSVVFAPDPLSPDPHPDHRAVAWAAYDALYSSNLPLVHPEHRQQGAEPHFVSEKYFYTEHQPSANKFLDIGETIDLKLCALNEHESQVQFLVEDVLRQAAYLDPPFPGIEQILQQAVTDPAAALSWFLHAQAAEAGQKIGVAYAEAFRYARFHPLIESILNRGS